MKYEHAVKYNGKFYPAGAEVPVSGENKKPDTGEDDKKSGDKKPDTDKKK